MREILNKWEGEGVIVRNTKRFSQQSKAEQSTTKNLSMLHKLSCFFSKVESGKYTKKEGYNADIKSLVFGSDPVEITLNNGRIRMISKQSCSC